MSRGVDRGLPPRRSFGANVLLAIGRLRRGRFGRVAGGVIGVVLLGGAVYAGFSQGGLSEAFVELGRAVSDDRRWALVVLLVLPLVSLVTTSLSLWLLTRRFGRVGFGEMFRVVSAATLLNYLPMRPGMMGRLAYHKRVNGIALKDSIRVLFEGLVLSLLSAGVLLGLGLSLGTGLIEDGSRLLVGGLIGLPIVLGVAAGMWSGGVARVWCFAWCIRYVDMVSWAGRYVALLWLLGAPLSLANSVLIAGVSQLAMFAPTGAGGVGVREWSVALVGGSLGAEMGLVLAADLLNRAVEVLIYVPIGLWGVWWVRGRMRAHVRPGISTSGGSVGTKSLGDDREVSE